MEETTNRSGMSTGMIVGIAVIVAILFGGGAYAYVNNKAEKEKKDLNAQITELQSQVSSATTATTTTPSSSTSTTAATDETASWKTYTSDKYGFSIKYPSNRKIDNACVPLGADANGEAVCIVPLTSQDPGSSIYISPYSGTIAQGITEIKKRRLSWVGSSANPDSSVAEASIFGSTGQSIAITYSGNGRNTSETSYSLSGKNGTILVSWIDHTDYADLSGSSKTDALEATTLNNQIINTVSISK
jgi:outer membrane murein-binding lipoprotein Lpp